MKNNLTKKVKNKKNVSKTIPNGRTLQTRDEYLESGKGKNNIKPEHPNPKDLYRRVGVIDSNRNDELAVIKLSTKGRHKIEEYLDGKSKFKAFIEISDNNGSRIKIDNLRFIENSTSRDLTSKQVNKIKKICLSDRETSKTLLKENRSKVRILKNRK